MAAPWGGQGKSWSEYISRVKESALSSEHATLGPA